MAQSKTIVFIHGLFQNPRSWDRWLSYFSGLGYACHAPAYPFHDGDPATLRRNTPQGLGRLTFAQVIDNLTAVLDKLSEPPILIGHSMGGVSCSEARVSQTRRGRHLHRYGSAEGGVQFEVAFPEGEPSDSQSVEGKYSLPARRRVVSICIL